MGNKLTDQELNALENSYTYHGPKNDQAERYQQIRDTAKSLATILMINCPHSRERSTALTRLEEAVMWANKAIACNE